MATDTEREQWEKRINKENISYLDFYEMQRNHKQIFMEKKKSSKILKDIRGELYIYRTKIISMGSKGQKKVFIDGGFENYIPLPKSASKKLCGGYRIQSLKEDKTYHIKHRKETSKDILYTYKAYLERVVDGDTLIVVIDCGFNIFRRERLRLKGIDAPELKTLDGKYTKKFIEKILTPLNFIIIKTYGYGKYARSLVDVFYSKNKDPHHAVSNGTFLNQELLDKGLASVWQLQ